ncbi:MAG: hypothetical protein GY870_04390 [archaeon]|nr:hypothetical protein [archaeon]
MGMEDWTFINYMDIFIKCFGVVFAFYCTLKSKPRSTLRRLFLLMGLAPIFQIIDDIFYGNLYNVRIGYALIMIGTALYNTALLYFAAEVFLGEPTTMSKRINLIKPSFLIVTLLITSVGAINIIFTLVDGLDTILIIFYMVIVLGMNLFLGINAYKLSAKLDDEKYKISIRYIGHFSFTLLGIYFFFILDSFAPTEVYTIWATIAWIVYLFALIFGYIGFVKPRLGKND